MTGLIRRLEAATRGIEVVAGILMAAITLLVVASAIGRYLFAWPIPDAFDLSRLLLGAAILWGLASVGYRGSHIKVDLLAEALPARIRRWIDAFAWLVLLGFTLLLAWKLGERVLNAAASNESTMDLRLPFWPFMALAWAGVAVSVLAILARIALIVSGRASLEHHDSAEIRETLARDAR